MPAFKTPMPPKSNATSHPKATKGVKPPKANSKATNTRQKPFKGYKVTPNMKSRLQTLEILKNHSKSSNPYKLSHKSSKEIKSIVTVRERIKSIVQIKPKR
jgi:hypothetical protein